VMAEVDLQDWEDADRHYTALSVRVADNGVVEVECQNPEGQIERRAWWRWKCGAAADLYAYIEHLQSLPGWDASMRDLIFTNLEARRAARVQRWIAAALNEASESKGAAFKRS